MAQYGIVYIKVNGVQYRMGGSMSIDDADFASKEPMVGLDGVHGRSVTKKAPTIEVELMDAPDVPMEALKNLDNATITAELSQGITYVLSGAWTQTFGAANAQDGKRSITFAGARCVRQGGV